MKSILSIAFSSVIILAVVACRDKVNPPTPTPDFWQPVSDVNVGPIKQIQATATSLVLQNAQGFLRVDPTNTIVGRANLDDSLTLDYPACMGERYSVVISSFLQKGQESVIAVYNLDRPAQPPLRVPLNQLLKPLPGYTVDAVPYNYTGSESLETVPLLPTGSGSGTVDNDGNLLLVFTGYSPTQSCTCLLHYYKYKITADAQNNLSLQYVSDYADELKVGVSSISTKLASTGGQQFRIRTAYANRTGSVTTQLFRITPQGADQLLLTAPYDIDNLFQLNNTMYIVTSTSELWASSDSGVSWQKTRTLTSPEKVFFDNCTTGNGTPPLVSTNGYRPLFKTGINAKTDTLNSSRLLVKRVLHVQQRYYVVTSNGLLYYADDPYNIR